MQPPLDVHEGLSARNIINHNNPVCPSVVPEERKRCVKACVCDSLRCFTCLLIGGKWVIGERNTSIPEASKMAVKGLGLPLTAWTGQIEIVIGIEGQKLEPLKWGEGNHTNRQ